MEEIEKPQGEARRNSHGVAKRRSQNSCPKRRDFPVDTGNQGRLIFSGQAGSGSEGAGSDYVFASGQILQGGLRKMVKAFTLNCVEGEAVIGLV